MAARAVPAVTRLTPPVASAVAMAAKPAAIPCALKAVVIRPIPAATFLEFLTIKA